MSAPTAEAIVLDRLATSLPDMTAEQLTRTAARWAALPGRVAIAARVLVDAELAWRWRVARTNAPRRSRVALAGGAR